MHEHEPIQRGGSGRMDVAGLGALILGFAGLEALRSPDQTVAVCTAVFHESRIGAVDFAPVLPVRRRGLPFLVSEMVRTMEGLDR